MAIQRSKRGSLSRKSEGEGNPLMCLFMEELADAHNAEQQLTKALPKMVKFAQSSELKEAFESHLEETRNHITRLEQAAESFGQSIGKKKCQGMEGIVDEGEDMADDFEDSPACDAALIAAAQKVEHYEIASYGTLCTWAQTLGHTEALELLRENLEEEKQADEKLTRIAESAANIRAEQEEEEEEV